jgi:hypothetical protein
MTANTFDLIQTIMFQYNVQHDCQQAKCVASGKQAIIQERVQGEVSKPRCFIKHKPLDCFLINTHAFHNAHLIRAAVPQKQTLSPDYKPRDIVYLNASNIQTNQPSRKLSHRRLGPFPIIKKVRNSAYRLQLPVLCCWHLGRLYPWVCSLETEFASGHST